MRRILLEKTYNTRDIGGFLTEDENMTAWGRFFRSDAPMELVDADRKTLRELNIKAVIDLRSDREAEQQPGFQDENAPYTYHRVSMYGVGKIPPSPEEIPPLYLKMADDHENIKRIFSIILDTDGAVLYHCAGGKDRTGIVTALLLLLANVPISDIEVDYSVSELYLMPVLRYLCEKYDISHDVVASKLIYIEAFLSLFRDKYHNVAQYFREVGFTDGEIAKLREKILA